MMLFQRRIFFELMGNAFTTMLLLLVVVLLITSVQVMGSVDGLSLWVFLTTIPVLVGVSLGVLLPISVLVAVVMTYGRAASDNEVDTLRASGVYPLHLLTPGLVFGALMSVLLLIGADELVPMAERAKRRILRDVNMSEVVAQKLASGEPEWLGNILVSSSYTDANGVAHDMHIQYYDDKGRVEKELVSETARAFVDPESSTVVLELYDYRTVVGPHWASKYWRVTHVLGSTDADLKLAAMTTAQLKAWLKRPEGERGMFTPVKVQTEVALRTSSAAVCLVFVLLGIPVALRFRRSDRLGAFLAAFLLALFLYFPSVKVAKALALSGALPPHLAVWMGHALMLVAGLLFSRKLAHR